MSKSMFKKRALAARRSPKQTPGLSLLGSAYRGQLTGFSLLGSAYWLQLTAFSLLGSAGFRRVLILVPFLRGTQGTHKDLLPTSKLRRKRHAVRRGQRRCWIAKLGLARRTPSWLLPGECQAGSRQESAKLGVARGMPSRVPPWK